MKKITPITRRASPREPAPALAALPATSSRGSPEVRLEIHELVLHGFAGAEARRVATATRAELTRLVTAHGLPHAHVMALASDLIDGGAVRRAPSQPELTGRRIARAIYGGMRP